MNHRRAVASCQTALRVALSRQIVANSLKISLVVGTALNVINQWDNVMSGSGLLTGNLILNYLVPYCVATFSAVRTLASSARDAVAPAEGTPCNETRAEPRAPDA